MCSLRLLLCFQPFAIAVIVPDEHAVQKWAEAHGLEGRDLEQLCRTEQLHTAVLDDIRARGKEAGLKGFEQVRACASVLMNHVLTTHAIKQVK